MKRVILGILTALLISGTAYAGWNALENKQKPQNTNTQQPDQTTPKPSEDTYLVIKEWGVRMKLGDAVKDAKYRYLPEYEDISLSTDSVEKVQGCQNGAIFGIARARKGEHLGGGIAGDTRPDQPNPYIQVGDYYYLLTGPGLGCASQEDRSGTELLSKVRKGLADAQKTLEKAPDM